MTDYDMSIHTNPDAAAWARFFMETWNKLGKPEPDEDWMIGWFANAMMAMHDHMRPDLAPVVLSDGSAFATAMVHECHSSEAGDTTPPLSEEPSA